MRWRRPRLRRSSARPTSWPCRPSGGPGRDPGRQRAGPDHSSPTTSRSASGGSSIKDAATLTKALVAAGRPSSRPERDHRGPGPSRRCSNRSSPSARTGTSSSSRPVPAAGHGVESSAAQQAITPGLSSGIVGTVGAITAQELKSLGGAVHREQRGRPDWAGSLGRAPAAGTPTAVAEVVTAKGAHVATLETLPGKPGTPVRDDHRSNCPGRGRVRAGGQGTQGQERRAGRGGRRYRGRARPSPTPTPAATTRPCWAVSRRVDVQGADLDRADRGRAHPVLGGQLARPPPPWTARCSTTPTAKGRSATCSRVRRVVQHRVHRAGDQQAESPDFPSVASAYRLGKAIQMGTPAFAVRTATDGPG